MPASSFVPTPRPRPESRSTGSEPAATPSTPICGYYDGIADAYGRLFGSWLPESGEELDDRPCMEIYRNSPLDTAPEQLLTDLVPTVATCIGGLRSAARPPPRDAASASGSEVTVHASIGW